MHARKRLDIGWSDLASGFVSSVLSRDGGEAQARVERWFGGDRGDSIVCLSVRSALELYLEVLALPRGSEVLVSALTIPDMVRVLEHHGLVAVPVDVDPRTLAPRPEAWRAAATPRTRLALAAHLFGTRTDLGELFALARERGWRVLEDHAQSFTGAEFKGDPRADVSLFSFGPIKTATALAGGVARVADRAVLAEMRERMQRWPEQDRGAFRARILKYAGLKLLSTRPCYTAFAALLAARGLDIDQVIQSSVRGFAGGDFFEKIRHRPCPALLALLARRLERGSRARVEGRIASASRVLARARGELEIPGAQARIHTYWVFTVIARDPVALVSALRARGFDATRVATLAAVAAPPDRPEADPKEARALLARLVYLPVYPEMSEDALDELGQLLAAQSSPSDARIETAGAGVSSS